VSAIRQKSAPLLVEILTEELPPLALQRLSRHFTDEICEGLRAQELLAPGTQCRPYATPRRLAVLIDAVRAVQPEREIERRGPAAAAAINGDGKPSPALIGFARSCGVEIAALERLATDKGEYFVFRRRQPGEKLDAHLPGLVEAAAKRLPVPKLMRWGAGETQFVRPVHGVVMLHGTRVVPGSVLGHRSGRATRGHRVLAKGPVLIARAADYAETLREQGCVVADFEERRNEIERQLRAAARELRAGTVLFSDDAGLRSDDGAAGHEAQEIARRNESVLDEVAALVEWPVVLRGDFDVEFLRVPAACLALAMQQHQRYFPLLHPRQPGLLLPHFLMVSNLKARNARNVVRGNERVLRARLADARFFFEHDQKAKLADRVPRLAQVVYHHRLGSQLQRVERVQRVAVEVARLLNLQDAEVGAAERAAYLCKADLLTDMVGEFPELQGQMGARYAAHDGELRPVAEAIREHYYPRYSGDQLPASSVGFALALADRLERLVGMFGIGQRPTGDKDPFALRRAALGVVQLLVEGAERISAPAALDARGLLEFAAMQFRTGMLSAGAVEEVYEFLLDRLRPFLRDRGHAADEIEAVLSLKPARFNEIPPRLAALRVFRDTAAGMALAAANKRIGNILRQAGEISGNGANADLMREPEELNLWRCLAEVSDGARADAERGDFAAALARLATLREPVDRYFDKVLVMAEDRQQRDNRLALLNAVRLAFRHVADVSQLQVVAGGG
jgi:glycyl-tRNA synthetase beta chain